ncbi:hypothetical protein R1sor_009866 [Riccia sorocarpa]|uniref:Plectin/eS10 N-terminal domain-containing protein n=1 Tax=Riccia sorocarpa TaxID=122646 RepID=A0ABD3HWB1_9MARC
MLIPKKNRVEVYKFLFKEGVLYAKKDFNAPKHPEIDVPNLQVIKLMQSFKSKEYVRESFAWRHYYWPLGGGPGDRAPRGGPPRFEGDRPRFGDREGYRGGAPRGPPGSGFGGDKGGAPGEYRPEFRGGPSGGRGGFGRGGGGFGSGAAPGPAPPALE